MQGNGLHVAGSRRPGRGHRRLGIPCQDAFAVHRDPERRRAAAAVADGLGSRPLSHLGSQAACDAAMASLAAEAEWDEPALRRAFAAAREAVATAAAERGLTLDDLATTLQLATLSGGTARAAMVGDGAVAAAADGQPATVLLAPAETEYANVVLPLTHPDWEAHLRFAELQGADSLLLFTDGLTRLLLSRTRTAWSPFAPFFDAFLPQLRDSAFDASVVERFVQGDDVDRSWDDDKCLVVLHAAAV